MYPVVNFPIVVKKIKFDFLFNFSSSNPMLQLGFFVQSKQISWLKVYRLQLDFIIAIVLVTALIFLENFKSICWQNVTDEIRVMNMFITLNISQLLT